jgi:hypothetical protein
MTASTFLRPRALGLFQGETRQRLCIHGLPSRCDTGVARQIDTCNTGYSDYLFLVSRCGIPLMTFPCQCTDSRNSNYG